MVKFYASIMLNNVLVFESTTKSMLEQSQRYSGYTLEKTTEVLTPPKPKELHTACSMFFLMLLWGT